MPSNHIFNYVWHIKSLPAMTAHGWWKSDMVLTSMLKESLVIKGNRHPLMSAPLFVTKVPAMVVHVLALVHLLFHVSMSQALLLIYQLVLTPIFLELNFPVGNIGMISWFGLLSLPSLAPSFHFVNVVSTLFHSWLMQSLSASRSETIKSASNFTQGLGNAEQWCLVELTSFLWLLSPLLLLYQPWPLTTCHSSHFLCHCFCFMGSLGSSSNHGSYCYLNFCHLCYHSLIVWFSCSHSNHIFLNLFIFHFIFISYLLDHLAFLTIFLMLSIVKRMSPIFLMYLMFVVPWKFAEITHSLNSLIEYSHAFGPNQGHVAWLNSLL